MELNADDERAFVVVKCYFKRIKDDNVKSVLCNLRDEKPIKVGELTTTPKTFLRHNFGKFCVTEEKLQNGENKILNEILMKDKRRLELIKKIENMGPIEIKKVVIDIEEYIAKIKLETNKQKKNELLMFCQGHYWTEMYNFMKYIQEKTKRRTDFVMS